MTTVKFTSFGRPVSGRLVTQENDVEVVFARNPYGRHNLVMVSRETREAFRHGNLAVVAASAAWMTPRRYRRVRQFLAARGVGIHWAVETQ